MASKKVYFFSNSGVYETIHLILCMDRNKLLQLTTSQPEEPQHRRHRKFSFKGTIVKERKLDFNQNFLRNSKER